MNEVEREMDALKDETMAQLRTGKMVPDLIEPWWDGRRENEQTPDYLGRVLDAAGLPGLAERARMGHFDGFHAPAEVADGAELIRLVAELRIAARDMAPELAARVAVVENAVRRGEFDATKAESDRWAASKDGQETMGELLRSVGRNAACPCGSGKKFKRCHGA